MQSPEQLTLAAESAGEYPEADEAVEQQIQRLELEMKAAAKRTRVRAGGGDPETWIRALRLRESNPNPVAREIPLR